MKKALPIFITEFVISLIFAFTTNGNLFSYDFFTMLGLGNLIIGLLSFFLSLIIYFVDKEAGKPWFIASGLILLAGCLTCTAFQIRINNGH